MTLNALFTQSKSDSETHTFLETLKVPSISTDSSSELVPFAGRLCGRLAEHVSEMKSLFAESSPSDGTISALAVTLPSESSILNGNTLLEVVCEGFTLLHTLLDHSIQAFQRILIKCSFVPLLKSTIVTCLDLLEQQKTDSNCQPPDSTDFFLRLISCCWHSALISLCHDHESLHPIVDSVFSDIPQLCSLLERTCCHSSPTSTYHLSVIINLSVVLPDFIPSMLEENLVHRVINTSKPMTVPTTRGTFHLRLIRIIRNLISNPKYITKNKEIEKRIRLLQFEHALKPAKQYLLFILQREEFILKAKSSNYDLPTTITHLLDNTLLFERELFQDGEIVETGREEWEVGWLVEKTHERELGERLKMIREEDVRMKKNEKSRWKQRVERQRESGHEDALEGWLMRRDKRTQSEILEYLKCMGRDNEMNVRHGQWSV
ncbi:hypothetical protein BLNAU_10946 [Blattamonas nauphoetae]|uniref:Uncharacterized protein n=1 Tax=Blattamonas nauphoetae TaxID=2049346 RepID=A0ABQ9XSF0_9EUKA|nr:hypothetical protein BLNAU_10946 [Blattamonas nauphoetae]